MLYEHYEETGGMKEALARHAQETFDKLADDDPIITSTKSNVNNLSRKQLIAKTVFQALTDASSGQKGGRRPTELQNIYDILTNKAINASPAEVDEVINCFRNEETSFIMPPSNTRLHPGLMLDISHESLMRNWHDLKDNWIKEETTAAELYRRLNDNREQYERDGETFTGGVLLRDLLQGEKTGLYNAAWAERYQRIPADINNNSSEKNKTNKEIKHELFSKNLDYLDRCQKRSLNEIKKEKKRRNEKVRNNRLIAALSILIAVSIISLGAYAFVQRERANKEEAQRKIELANSAANAQRKIDSVNAQAEAQKRIAAIKAQAEMQRKIDADNLQFATALANAKADSAINAAKANAKADSAINATNSVFNRLHEILELVNEPFYTSNFLDSSKKNQYVDTLVQFRYKFNNLTRYNHLLYLLDATSEIFNLAQANPNVALQKAISLHDSLNNNITDTLLSSIVKNNAFLSRKIYFPRSYDSIPPILSNDSDRSYVAALHKDTIKIYKIFDDSLIKVRDISTQQYTRLGENLYNARGPGTMNFAGQDKLIVFTNNKLHNINLNDASYTVLQIPQLSVGKVPVKYSVSSISPDGKKLALVFHNNQINVWDIDSLNNPPRIITLDSSDGQISTMRFSSDAKKIVIKQSKAKDM